MLHSLMKDPTTTLGAHVKRGAGMDHWWSTIDHEVLDLLQTNGPMAPADLGRKLGLSESAVASCLAMLAAEGRVRIRLVERPLDQQERRQAG